MSTFRFLPRLGIAVVLLAHVAVVASLASNSVRAGEPDKPEAVIESFHDVLMDVMQNAKELGYQGRFDRLAPTVTDVFDLDYMSAVSVGRNWKSLNSEQQARLKRAFSQVTIATYANRFDGYSGQKFVIDRIDEAPGNRVLVKSRLVRRNGEAVELSYLMHYRKNGWHIADIFLDGKISELATRRAEYSSVYQGKGFDALIDALESKVARLATDS